MKMTNVLLIGAFAIAGLSCSHKATVEEKKLEQEVQAQPAREMHGGVAAKGMEAILSSNSLTAEQKKELLQLHGKMAKETFQIQEETSQLKGVLFEAITSKPYDRKKVNILKKKLVALNDKKMKNMLQGLDDVQRILGEKTDEEIQDFYRPFFWEHAHQLQEK